MNPIWWKQRGKPLPKHFVSPVEHALTSRMQIPLFPVALGEAMASLQISVDEAARWFAKGWLSFDPGLVSEDLDAAGDHRLMELEIVRDVTRSGMPDYIVEYLLDCLGPPLRFDADRVGWSFRHGWVEPAPPDPPFEVVSRHLSDYLVSLRDDEKFGELLEIHSEVARLLGDQVPSGRQEAE